MKTKMGTTNTAAYDFYIACGVLFFVYLFCRYYYKNNSSELLETAIIPPLGFEHIPNAIIIPQQEITDIEAPRAVSIED